MRTAYAVAVFLLSCSAFGGTITSLNPPSIPYRGGEFFLTINGSSLGDRVIFEGAPGTFELETSASGTGYVISWIPQEIVNDPGTYTVHVSGRDGDSNRVGFTVTKPGRPLLQLHLPELLAVPARSREGAGIKYEVSMTGPDPAGTTIKCDPPSGSLFKFGTSRITCIASDTLGNDDRGQIDVTVWDGTPPVLELPKSFELPGDDERGAYVKYSARGFDEIDGELATTCLPESGSYFPNGRTTVNCETADLSLNPSSGSFEVMVQPKDIGRLELKVPEKVVEATTDGYGAAVSFEVIAYGSADPDPVVECNPASGSYFELGTSKVYCVAQDDFGQRAEGGFVVEVVERLGLKLPDVSAEAMSPSGTAVTWEAAAENWTSSITCTPGSGALFSLGATAVECESTDDRGRRAIGTFKVNVADTIAPHIGRIRTNAGAANGEVVPLQVAVEAIDAADAMPRCSVSTLTAEGGDAFDWRIKGDLEVEIRAGANRPFRLQVSCVDASGNRSNGSVPVSLGNSTRRGPIAN
jgi:hypothetical protein